MDEKVYKTMKSTGVTNIVLGIVAIVSGVATGVMLIVAGARLLKKKSSILF